MKNLKQEESQEPFEIVSRRIHWNGSISFELVDRKGSSRLVPLSSLIPHQQQLILFQKSVFARIEASKCKGNHEKGHCQCSDCKGCSSKSKQRVIRVLTHRGSQRRQYLVLDSKKSVFWMREEQVRGVGCSALVDYLLLLFNLY